MRVPAGTSTVLAAAVLLASLAGCHRGSDLSSADLAASRAHRAANAPEASARARTPAEGARAAASASSVAPRTAVASASPAAPRPPAASDGTKVMGAPSGTIAAAIASATPERVDDASITRKVRAAIAADKDLRPLKIDVDTQNGIVTLSGPTPTVSAKAHADEVARRISGVVSVNNQLTLQAG